MKYITLDIPPAGSWKRDCELVHFNFRPLWLEILKESDETKWKIKFNGLVAFKITSEEFTIHLKNTPKNGSFYLIEDSFWISDLNKTNSSILEKCKHYVLFFYDETLEVIAQDLVYEKIK
jgi:hypothetical protein